MKTVQLTQGYIAEIDDEDFDLVSQYKWNIFKPKTGSACYARTSTYARQEMDAFMKRAETSAEDLMFQII